MSRSSIPSPTVGVRKYGSSAEKVTGGGGLQGIHRFYMCQKCRKSFRLLGGGGLGKGVDQSFQWLEDTMDEGLTAEELHETVSVLAQHAADKVNTDMPLCRECCELVSWGPSGLAERLKMSTMDEETYSMKLKELETEEVAGEEEAEEEEELARLKETEAELVAVLEELKAEEKGVAGQLNGAEGERVQMQNEVARFWGNLSDLAVAETGLRETAQKLERHLSVNVLDKARLTSANILNQVFHIWYDGHFVTINKLRLGKLQSQPIEQNETNAAWGYAAQLLVILLRIWEVRTTRYRVIPKGSFSIVQKIGSKSTLELWSGATGLWASTRYDNAITGFASCVDELCRTCIAVFPHEKAIPYPISDDTVGGLSVKMSAAQTDENWTRALKFLLLDLKWVVCMTTLKLKEKEEG